MMKKKEENQKAGRKWKGRETKRRKNGRARQEINKNGRTEKAEDGRATFIISELKPHLLIGRAILISPNLSRSYDNLLLLKFRSKTKEKKKKKHIPQNIPNALLICLQRSNNSNNSNNPANQRRQI